MVHNIIPRLNVRKEQQKDHRISLIPIIPSVTQHHQQLINQLLRFKHTFHLRPLAFLQILKHPLKLVKFYLGAFLLALKLY